MIACDANVLVRFVTQDDPGFVSVVTLVELHWVLRRAYKVGRSDAAAVIRMLLDPRELASKSRTPPAGPLQTSPSTSTSPTRRSGSRVRWPVARPLSRSTVEPPCSVVGHLVGRAECGGPGS